MQLVPAVNKQLRFLSATMWETEHQKYDAEVDEEPDIKVQILGLVRGVCHAPEVGNSSTLPKTHHI